MRGIDSAVAVEEDVDVDDARPVDAAAVGSVLGLEYLGLAHVGERFSQCGNGKCCSTCFL